MGNGRRGGQRTEDRGPEWNRETSDERRETRDERWATGDGAHCNDHFAKSELSKFLQNGWTHFFSFLSCRILISLGAICEKMTGVELVTAENKSEENLLKIGVV